MCTRSTCGGGGGWTAAEAAGTAATQSAARIARNPPRPRTVPSAAAGGGLGEVGADPSGFLDVAVHLRDQRVDAFVGDLVAQLLDEGDAQVLAVEVALEVDQVGLDQHAEVGVEGRADADVDRRRVAVGEGGVE